MMKSQSQTQLPPRQVRRLQGERETAIRIGMSYRWFQQQRLQGTGPKYIQLGERRILYDPTDVEEWLDARRVNPASAVRA